MRPGSTFRRRRLDAGVAWTWPGHFTRLPPEDFASGARRTPQPENCSPQTDQGQAGRLRHRMHSKATQPRKTLGHTHASIRYHLDPNEVRPAHNTRRRPVRRGGLVSWPGGAVPGPDLKRCRRIARHAGQLHEMEPHHKAGSPSAGVKSHHRPHRAQGGFLCVEAGRKVKLRRPRVAGQGLAGQSVVNPSLLHRPGADVARLVTEKDQRLGPNCRACLEPKRRQAQPPHCPCGGAAQASPYGQSPSARPERDFGVLMAAASPERKPSGHS